MRYVVLALLLGLGCPACKTAAVSEIVSQESNNGEESVKDEGLEHDPYAPTYGPEVEVEALYLVEPVPGGKRLQATSLRFEDGKEWIRAYRPVAGELAFFEKRVIVRGRTYTPSPMVQHVGGVHFELESIELAPGETPHEPALTELPAPPVTNSLAKMAARSWRWVHVQGKLTSLSPEKDGGFWGDGELVLDNGERVLLRGVRASDEHLALIGKDVTAMGRVVDKGVLSGRLRLCPGRVSRCGMVSRGVRK